MGDRDPVGESRKVVQEEMAKAYKEREKEKEEVEKQRTKEKEEKEKAEKEKKEKEEKNKNTTHDDNEKNADAIFNKFSEDDKIYVDDGSGPKVMPDFYAKKIVKALEEKKQNFFEMDKLKFEREYLINRVIELEIGRKKNKYEHNDL